MTTALTLLRKLCPAVLAVLLIAPAAAPAQTPFAAAIRVGDGMVTRYQLDQRTRFLSLLNAPGNPADLAREQLINEAVQMKAAKDAEITADKTEVEAAMTDFAGRANMDTNQFVTALGQNGVGPETFRDLITAGVVWRAVIRAQMLDSARQFPHATISRTLAANGTPGGLRMLVSEIILPATTPETAAASRARAADILANVKDETGFAAAARRYSVAPSSAQGGALNWADPATFPPEAQKVIETMKAGQFSKPVDLNDAIGIFLVRGRQTVKPGKAEPVLTDYALFLADGGRAGAEAVARRADTCDDLYGAARGLPANRLMRQTVPVASLAPDIRAALAGLDVNETSTALTRDGFATVLMLCARAPGGDSTVDFDLVGNELLNGRLAAMAADRLAELRAATRVVVLTR